MGESTRVVEPFADGSVSIGLHPDSSLRATEQVADLLRQAELAATNGFDGVTFSEHHVGFPGYLPQPLLAANWVLASVPSVWAGPAPTLLGLRSPRLLAEELAWTAARYPGRVGAALAPGYVDADFDAIGIDKHARRDRFSAQLDDVLDSLEGRTLLAADPAIEEGTFSVARLLLAANSKRGVRRAAALGLGVLFPGGEPADRLAELVAEYRRAGGVGPTVGIVVVWIGGTADSTSEVEERFRSAAQPSLRQVSGVRRGPFTSAPTCLAEELAAHVTTAGLTALNVRFIADAASPQCVAEQIALFAASMLGPIRAALRSSVAKQESKPMLMPIEDGIDQ